MHGAKAGLLGVEAAAACAQLREAREHRSEDTVGRAGLYRIFQKRAQGDTMGSTVASLRTGGIWLYAQSCVSVCFQQSCYGAQASTL